MPTRDEWREYDQAGADTPQRISGEYTSEGIMPEPTQEQIEAAARALFNNINPLILTWEDEANKKRWRSHAKAALMAAAALTPEKKD